MFLRRLLDRLSGRADRDLEREIRAHQELEQEEYETAGLSPEEARYAAQRALGNATLIKEETRTMWGWTLLDQLAQDLRYAVRTLLRTPAFTAVAVLCLALGIGANTAIFTLLDRAMLRSLPVAEPERLVIVQSLHPSGRGGSSFSYPQFAYLRDHASAVAATFAYSRIDLNLSAGELTDSPAGLLVSDNYFSALGVQPVLGRRFEAADEAAAVIGYRYWQSRFQGDPGIVGRAIVLNGMPFTVIGVSPRSFFGTETGKSPDVFMPLASHDYLFSGTRRLAQPNSFWLNVMARLRPEIPDAQAAAQTDVVYHQGIDQSALPARLAGFLHQRRIAFAPGAKGTNSIGAQFGTPLVILMIIVSLVLLIACANVANLLLSRAAARRKEIAVRLALGASRGRLVRQLLTESMALSAAGGVLGLLFAAWSARALTGFLTGQVIDVSLDARVLGFTLVVSIVTGLLFGVTPGLRAARVDLTPAFKGEAVPESAGRRMYFGKLLVSGQVAISLMLLTGAGLFIRTLANLRALDAGFRGDHVLLATLNPGLSRYDLDRSNAFFDSLLQRVSALPGVHSASLAEAALLKGTYIDGFSIEGANESDAASLRLVKPRFFETMGIAIRLGRDFSAGDHAGSPKVAIINETIARKYFAGQNPLGKQIRVDGLREIIGVIADTKYRNLREAIPNTVYLPLDQAKQWSPERTLHVRTFAGPAGMAASVREQVRALDKNLPVEISLFTDLVDQDLSRERLIATLSGFFGGLALLLTATGLYGVIAYNVQRRTREIGIRMSLGARRAEVLWLVLRDCLVLAGIGIALGTPASLWCSRLIARQLFGVAPGDPATIAAAAGFLILIAALAGFLPARRASRVDPMAALRYE